MQSFWKLPYAGTLGGWIWGKVNLFAETGELCGNAVWMHPGSIVLEKHEISVSHGVQFAALSSQLCLISVAGPVWGRVHRILALILYTMFKIGAS